MWALNNTTPFACERSWVRDTDGAEVWLVAVRATYDILADGTTELSPDQPNPLLSPKYAGDPARSSLLYDSDLVNKKISTDVLVHGHAHAPNGEPITQIDATIKVGPIRKTLRIYGNRRWDQGFAGLRLSPPERFVQMPIVYERAFGGVDQSVENQENIQCEKRNPVGMGFAVDARHLVGQLVPNIENAARLIQGWDDRPQPAGFGPIPGHWLPRAKYAGTYDAAWVRDSHPLLPSDFDDRFYNCAPADQQCPRFLRGGEPVELQNLTSGGGALRLNLPRTSIGFRTHFGSRTAHHKATLHTVILEPDFPRISLVWHTRLCCHHDVLNLRNTTVYEKRILGMQEGS